MKAKIFTTIIILSSLTTFGQTNYYVSPFASNSNNGSLSFPWQTIQYSLNQLSVGDTLNLLTGTYSEKISIPMNGIYIRKFVNNSPVIDATGITSQNPIISINNKSNITIDGIELKNNIQLDAQGILVDGNGSNITIKNCVIHDIHFSSNPLAPVNASTNAQGIIVYGNNSITAITDLKILNNQLYNCRLGYSEGIAVNGNVDGFEVTGNTVYNLTNIGIDLIGHEGTCPNPANDQARNGLIKNNIIHHCISSYASSGGIYIDGGKIITVENNISYHNGYGIEIGCENIGKTTDAITVRNNIFYDNEICALALGGFAFPSGSGKVINSTFKNNTCYYDDFSNNGSGELYLSYSENSIIENNVFYATALDVLLFAELTQPALSFNYNVFYCQSGTTNLTFDWNGIFYTGFSNFVAGSSTNVNSIFNNPLFVLPDITSPNFHITSSSPCFNTGNPAFVPSITERDMDGEVRVSGVVDCGADEYYATTSISENSQMKMFFIYPNPTSDIFFIEHIYEKAKIEIYNNIGQVVYEKSVAKKETINVTEYENGIYLITISNDEFRFTNRFIKQ